MNKILPSPPLSKLLTVPQVADILSASESTVRRLINSGQLPAHKLGGMLRIRQDELAQFIEGETNA